MHQRLQRKRGTSYVFGDVLAVTGNFHVAGLFGALSPRQDIVLYGGLVMLPGIPGRFALVFLSFFC